METTQTNGAPIVMGLGVAAIAIVLYFIDKVSAGYAVAGFVLASAAPVAGLLKFGRLAFGGTIALAVLVLVVGLVSS